MTLSTRASTQARGALRIAGRETDPEEPWQIVVADPATGAEFARLTGGGLTEARRAVDAADAALAGWEDTPAADRAAALRRIADDLLDPAVADDLAVVISRETGKRLAEAEAEVRMSAGFFRWFADAVAGRSDRLWNVVPGISHHVRRRALGVVAVVTPWNFPVSIPARKLAAALAAGCTAVFKPSQVAPLSGLILAEIVDRHVPAGALNTVVVPAKVVGEAWIGDPRVRGITFTGSTAVGTRIAAQAAEGMKRTVLELGGNAPFVVLPDADPAAAAAQLMVAKYRNNGQSCIAANHVWLPRERFDDHLDAFLDATDALVLGDPCDPATTLGPLALPDDPARIAELADRAEASGDRVHRFGGAVPAHGFFAPPVVVVRPGLDAPAVRCESFGPALAVLAYDDPAEVLRATRGLDHGLAGYVCGSDTHRAAEFARRLDVGIVGVNTGTPNTPHVPFAGLKQSGVGTEGGHAGLEEFLSHQTVAVAG